MYGARRTIEERAGGRHCSSSPQNHPIQGSIARVRLCHPRDPPPPASAPRPGGSSSSSAARSSSTRSTSRWSASPCRRSAPTSTCPTAACSGSSAPTCSASAASCCSAGAPPTSSAGDASSSSRWPSSPSRRAWARVVDEGSLLIAMRFIKGVSAAFTAPAGLSIITTSFPEGPLRNRAISIYTATGATGFSLGLVIGGLITEIGWRWVFLLPVPVAIVTLIAAIALVPDAGRPSMGRRGFDLAGAADAHRGACCCWSSPSWRPRRRLGLGPHARVPGRGRRPAHRLRRHRAPHRAAARAARASCARPRSCAPNVGAMSLFGGWVGFQFVATLYMQQAARLVAARDRAGDPARAGSSWR